MNIPKHLKILIVIMGFGIAMQIFNLASSLNNFVPSKSILNLLGIIISIGIIKGFINRSRIAWHFAIGLSILFFIAVTVTLFILITVQVSGLTSWIYLQSFINLTIEIYTIWVLFSNDVRFYFSHKNTEDAQPDA